MEVYEVKHQLYSIAGSSFLILNTVRTTNPEDARKLAYKMVLKNKPDKAKVKFLYVRKVTDSSRYETHHSDHHYANKTIY